LACGLLSLLALGGFFELYDLFQTGYISTGLLAEDIFHTGEQGIFGISDQAAFASPPLWGCLLAPACCAAGG
jgi:putative MFS transporter